MRICSFRCKRRISRGRRRGFGSSTDYSMLPLRSSVIQGRRSVLQVSTDTDLARASGAKLGPGYFINYAVDTDGLSSAKGAKLLAGAQGAFATGRFTGTFFMKFVRPRWVFLVYLTCVVAFLAAASGARHSSGISKCTSDVYDRRLTKRT